MKSISSILAMTIAVSSSLKYNNALIIAFRLPEKYIWKINHYETNPCDCGSSECRQIHAF
ncbi:MAG: hypothetical protein IJV35_03280 [Neisseriaceae bacterium]|nr:hypothetical protein [Neisseriaceae bacterium]